MPRDHVLTKTFYLLQGLSRPLQPPASSGSRRSPADDEDEPASRPARAGDGVSSIIITSNDLAGAWAMRPDGQAMLPLVPGEPRQREFAFRAGVNIVMYTLTGNYKADQVHVPALLERLGAVQEAIDLNFGISFAPLVPAYVVWAALAAACVSSIAADRVRAAAAAPWCARIALALFVLALANPSLTREDRDPLTSVAVVVVDKSPSQDFGDRAKQTEAARAALAERLGRIPGIEVRFVEAGQADGETDGTRLFTALATALSDVPHDRVAGAILITDGRVHDVPAEAAALGFAAPVHALITGHANERDRRVVLVTAPRFGIVGQTQTITFRVEDQGAPPGPAQVTVRRDGETIENRNVRVGRAASASTCRSRMPGRTSSRSKPRRSTANSPPSTTARSSPIDGVRDKLRVLLVSGEPHAGERTWRNLLKSDATVDLVHFTILRPPEKQDGTPINELSLIAFPTRELFQQKINEFQLIIFDRYARQGVLPIIYFDNIARYVREGGAVLVAAGPDYASQTSLWRTPLDAILPAEPSGRITDTRVPRRS